MLTLRTILHANDLSPHGGTALEFALTLARDHRARLILLYVKPTQETIIGEFGTPPPEPEPSVQAYLQALQQLVPADANVAAECMVVDGVPGDEILRVARDKKCDAIVLGSHRHTWLGRLWSGDIVNQVAHKAPCPVITVRQPG